MEEQLTKIYYDPKTGYSGALELYRRAKKVNATMTLKRVKEFLAKQETAQVFKGTNKKKTHLHIEARRGSYQIDHTFMSNRKINNGYHAIFCAVEIGSRWAFVCPMKNIRHEAVLDAFEKLHEATRKRNPVLRIITDEGAEFGSNAVKAWLAEKGIAHRILHHDYHYYSNSIVERFNLTLKQKLQKYMVANKTKKWVDALEDVVYAYNRSKHSYHGERPKDVAKNPITQLIHRIKTIQSNLNIKAKKDFILNRIQTGTKIRLLRKVDTAFSKKIQKYSRKTYTVEGITKNRTMVQIDGKARMIRPWEIQKADVVESNPTPRVIKSPDVEQALANARKARKEGKASNRKANDPIVEELKKTKGGVSQSMVGKWIETEDGLQGTVVRATKTGLWLETFTNGKRYEMLIRKGDKTKELTSPPKAARDEAAPVISEDRMALVGTSYDMNSHKYSVSEVDSKRILLADESGRDYSIAIGDADEEDASHVLRLNLFAKTFEWKRYTLPIRTEEEGAPYWFGKALGKPRKATQWDSSKSGGEIDEGWLVIPILWYESLPGQAGVYSLTKNKHLLNLQHVLFAPRSVELVPTRKTKPNFTVMKEDHDMLLKYIASARARE